MKADLVIARFNEDLSWLEMINNDNLNIIVYNKGLQNLPIYDSTNAKIIHIENRGREAETYLRFIVDNYPNFKEFTVFIQGEPFEHMTNLMRFGDPTLNSGPKHYSHYLNIQDNDNHNQFKFIEYLNSNEYEYRQLSDYSYTRPIFTVGCSNLQPFDLRILLDDLFQNPPTEVTWFVGAQFIIPRELLLYRSKKFYQKLYELSKIKHYDAHHSGAHILERIWGIVFDKNYYEK